MSTQEVTLEQIDEMKANCKRAIDVANALDRLHKNTDFKTVFLDNYMRDDVVRLVGLLGEQTINLGGKKYEHREEIQERLIGVARFQEYMRNVFRLADQAENDLIAAEEAETEFHKTYDVTEQ